MMLTIQLQTMEIFVREAGFIPGREAVAVHRRLRYRLVASPNGSAVESELEIVHYTQNQPEHRMRANAIPLDAGLQNLLQQRAHLDQNGPIERKEFMLHDQASWPRLNFPSQNRPIPANPYQAGPMGGRPGMPGMPGMPGQPGPPPPFAFAQPPGMRPGGMMGPSPVKGRPQTSGPVPGVPGAMARPREENPILADEELAAAGDLMDLLTPRDLSAIRYKQHHEWMEEILASPYGTNQISPVSLRFQLSGDLSSITQGMFEVKDGQEPGRVTEEQVKELEKRVEAYQKTGEAQLADMRKTHQQKMAELSQQKLFATLERRLGEIRKTGPESQAAIEQLIEEAERATGAKLRSREEVISVHKGGLLERGKENVGMSSDDSHEVIPDASVEDVLAGLGDDLVGSGQSAGADNHGNGHDAGQDDFADFANLDTAGEALQDFYTDSAYDTMDFPA